MDDNTNKPEKSAVAPAETTSAPQPEKTNFKVEKPTIGPNMILTESINAGQGKDPEESKGD
jgi:hypothetical protein